MKTFIALLLSSIVLSGCEAAFAADNRNLPSRPRNPFVIRDGCGQNARLSITGRCVPIPVVEPFSQTLLSFAPLTDDVGLGAECACADITLEDGTPITYAHSTPSIPLGCVRGNELQVANGDLVFCTNKPRVMRGGDGTGGKGLSIWMPRVHYALHNTAMENAVWTKGGTNPPTVTGTNTIVAPDGTTTADAVAFGATSSYLYQAACSVNYEARWVWLRSEEIGRAHV